MKRDPIIQMAWDAGLSQFFGNKDQSEELKRFANLIAQHERKEWAEEFAGLGEWNCVHIIEDRCK